MDTSAWVEFLRGTSSPATVHVLTADNVRYVKLYPIGPTRRDGGKWPDQLLIRIDGAFRPGLPDEIVRSLPANAGESAEVSVVRDHGRPVLDRDRSQVRVVDEIPARSHLL